MRALRVDKMTIAALEATLRLYLQPGKLESELPLFRMIAQPLSELRDRGERLLREMHRGEVSLPVALEEAPAYVGGGSLPDQELVSIAVVVECPPERAESIKRALRCGDPSVFCRLRRNRLEFDLRTLRDEDLAPLARTLRAAWSEAAAVR
jgi:L-seryl-tRNA(Ser) seleniumtransferase